MLCQCQIQVKLIKITWALHKINLKPFVKDEILFAVEIYGLYKRTARNVLVSLKITAYHIQTKAWSKTKRI